jgi:hypothetical protein
LDQNRKDKAEAEDVIRGMSQVINQAEVAEDDGNQEVED